MFDPQSLRQPCAGRSCRPRRCRPGATPRPSSTGGRSNASGKRRGTSSALSTRFPTRATISPSPLPASPVIVLRDGEGELRAFANSCRHRGSELLEGSGNCKLISCPYHSWTYELNGGCAARPRWTRPWASTRRSTASCRSASTPGAAFSSSISTRRRGPLQKFLGGLPEKLAPYRLENMALVRRKTYDMACNWKLFVENAKESYHIGTVHQRHDRQIRIGEIGGLLGRGADGRICRHLRAARRKHGAAQGRQGLSHHRKPVGQAGGGRHLCAVDLSQHLSCLHDRLRLVPGDASSRPRQDADDPRRPVPEGPC